MNDVVQAYRNIDTSKAQLPASYEAAKTALAQCIKLDEAKQIKDKMMALNIYAKQVHEPELEKMAQRITLRAERRMGDILKTFQAPKGTTGAVAKDDGVNDHPTEPNSQREAAEEAGLSKSQEKKAVRLSNVPEDDFDAAVESDNPPTSTALAEQGKETIVKPWCPPRTPDPTWSFVWKVKHFHEEILAMDPAEVVEHMHLESPEDIELWTNEIATWFEQFWTIMQGEKE